MTINSFDSANILLHIAIISVFITTFFFTYGTYLEKKIFSREIDYMFEDISSSATIIAPELIYKGKDIAIDAMGKQNTGPSAADLHVRKSNKKVVDDAISMMIAFFIIILMIVVAIGIFGVKSGERKAFAVDLLKKNALALLFVAATEFYFATYYGQKYMSLNINALKKTVVDKFKEIRSMQ